MFCQRYWHNAVIFILWKCKWFVFRHIAFAFQISVFYLSSIVLECIRNRRITDDLLSTILILNTIMVKFYSNESTSFYLKIEEKENLKCSCLKFKDKFKVTICTFTNLHTSHLPLIKIFIRAVNY